MWQHLTNTLSGLDLRFYRHKETIVLHIPFWYTAGVKLDNNFLLIIAGIIAIVAELVLGVATGFDLFLIGVIFILAGVVGTLLNSFSIALGVVVVLSLLYVFVARAFIKSKLTIQTRNTNVDALIGKKGIVIKKITSQKPGQVKVEGEVWRAVSDAAAAEPLDEGAEVTVESVSGVTIQVK